MESKHRRDMNYKTAEVVSFLNLSFWACTLNPGPGQSEKTKKLGKCCTSKHNNFWSNIQDIWSVHWEMRSLSCSIRVEKTCAQAKQLARRLGLAHRPNTALLYLIQKSKASCQDHLYLCHFVQRKVIAISACHFHTSMPTASPFLLQTNIFDLIQTMGTSTLF